MMKSNRVSWPSLQQVRDIPITKSNIIPAGCKRYYFSIDGDISYIHQPGVTIFECTSLNDANAFRKFYNFKIKNHGAELTF